MKGKLIFALLLLNIAGCSSSKGGGDEYSARASLEVSSSGDITPTKGVDPLLNSAMAFKVVEAPKGDVLIVVNNGYLRMCTRPNGDKNYVCTDPAKLSAGDKHSLFADVAKNATGNPIKGILGFMPFTRESKAGTRIPANALSYTMATFAPEGLYEPSVSVLSLKYQTRAEFNRDVHLDSNDNEVKLGPTEKSVAQKSQLNFENLKRGTITYIAAAHNMDPNDVVDYSAEVRQINPGAYRVIGNFIVESDAPTNIYEAASAHVNSRICSLDPNQCSSKKFKHTVNFDAIATVYKKLDGSDGIKWDAKVSVDKPLEGGAAAPSFNDGLTDSERNAGWKRVLITSDVTMTDAFQQMGLGLADLQRVMDALGPDVSKFHQVASSPVDFMIKDQALGGFRFEAPPGRITLFLDKKGDSKILERKVDNGKFVAILFRCESGGSITYTNTYRPDCSVVGSETEPKVGTSAVSHQPASVSVSASFDCTKAANPTELAICSDDELAALDRKMGVTYRQNLKELGHSKTLLTAQRTWIAERNRDCGGDKDCIKTKLQARIQDLSPKQTRASTLSRDLQWAYRIDARYPPQAIRQRHEGTVVLLVLVGTDGVPKDIKVQTSAGYRELDRAAINAAKNWRFKPAIKNGEAVEGFMSAPVNFSLNHVSG